VIVRECSDRLRAAGVQAEAGTDHVYGRVGAPDRYDAMEKIDAGLGFKAASIASVWPVC